MILRIFRMQGRARMVDVSDKSVTLRVAVASGVLRMRAGDTGQDPGGKYRQGQCVGGGRCGGSHGGETHGRFDPDVPHPSADWC